MSDMSWGTDAVARARARRSSGSMVNFDGERLSLARRLARKQRTTLAEEVGVSAAAITQFERGSNGPSRAVASKLALALGLPIEFFESGIAIERIPTSAAHFRSLRSTPALSRERALAFAEMATAVVGVLEEYVEFPAVRIPTHVVDTAVSPDDIADIAIDTRRVLGIPRGPIAHVIRSLEAAGIVVLTMPPSVDAREVDAFSTDHGSRPLVLTSPAKNDRARSRFDAAHELGHLVMHPDVEPGSKVVEEQAQTFASQFLAPDEELLAEIPPRVDWNALVALKVKWKISLRALVFRAHRGGVWGDATYQRAMKKLSFDGYPELGDLGPRESPAAVGRAFDLLVGAGYSLDSLATASRLPLRTMQEVIDAGSEQRLRLL